MYRVVLLFVILQSLALGWVLSGGPVLASSITLAVVVICEWVWEFVSLIGTARNIEAIEPRVTAKSVMLIYAACWLIQTLGAAGLYLFMRVHTLPMAFELVACHVAFSALWYLTRRCVQGLPITGRAITIAGHPWWEAGASCAGISPSCGLFSILICKAIGLF